MFKTKLVIAIYILISHGSPAIIQDPSSGETLTLETDEKPEKMFSREENKQFYLTSKNNATSKLFCPKTGLPYCHQGCLHEFNPLIPVQHNRNQETQTSRKRPHTNNETNQEIKHVFRYEARNSVKQNGKRDFKVQKQSHLSSPNILTKQATEILVQQHFDKTLYDSYNTHFISSNILDKINNPCNQIVQTQTVDLSKNNEGLATESVTTLAEYTKTTIDNNDTAIKIKPVNGCTEEKQEKNDILIGEAKLRDAERTKFMCPLLLYYEKTITDINTKYVKDSLPCYWLCTICKYYQRNIEDGKETDMQEVCLLSRMLIDNTSYNTSTEDLNSAISKIQTSQITNTRENFIFKETLYDNIKNISFVFFKIKDDIEAEIKDDIKNNSENVKIFGNESIFSEVKKLLKNINEFTDITILNEKYKAALKLIFYNFDSNVKLYRHTYMLLYFMPELYFYLEWVTDDSNIDHNLTKNLVFTEIGQIFHLIELSFLTNRDMQCEQLEHKISHGIYCLRSFILARLMRVAPGTMRAGLYKLALYLEYNPLKITSHEMGELRILFVFAFILDHNYTIFEEMREYLHKYDNKIEFGKTLMKIVGSFLKKMEVSSEIFIALEQTIRYLETKRTLGINHFRIYMVFPYKRNVAILYKEKGSDLKSLQIITKMDCLHILLIKMMELIIVE